MFEVCITTDVWLCNQQVGRKIADRGTVRDGGRRHPQEHTDQTSGPLMGNKRACTCPDTGAHISVHRPQKIPPTQKKQKTHTQPSEFLSFPFHYLLLQDFQWRNEPEFTLASTHGITQV